MASYRIYCLDGLDKVASADWLEADDDDTALDRVREEHDGSKCEVWEGQRLVATLDLRNGATG